MCSREKPINNLNQLTIHYIFPTAHVLLDIMVFNKVRFLIYPH